MHERVKSSSDPSIEPKASLHDQFTEAEQERIDTIVKELDTDDAKELELCKAKLAVAEQKIIALNAQLKALHPLQLDEKTSRNILVHKQMVDKRNKLEASEAQHLKESKEVAKTNDKSVSPSLDAHSKVKVVVRQAPPLPPAGDVGLRRRSTNGNQTGAKPSLFSTKDSLMFEKEISLDDRNSCFRMDFCGIS